MNLRHIRSQLITLPTELYPPEKKNKLFFDTLKITVLSEKIKKNIKKSAMYSGQLDAKGPRYCPSIEDKIFKFQNKDSHQIFIEPEGVKKDLVYPNGISTSLPKETQVEFIRSIKGMENSEITEYGYAVEYDFVDPRSLEKTLQLNNLNNLYLAGQINGTTGYEEAAAQGLIAGINASNNIKKHQKQNCSSV